MEGTVGEALGSTLFLSGSAGRFLLGLVRAIFLLTLIYRLAEERCGSTLNGAVPVQGAGEGKEARNGTRRELDGVDRIFGAFGHASPQDGLQLYLRVAHRLLQLLLQ